MKWAVSVKRRVRWKYLSMSNCNIFINLNIYFTLKGENQNDHFLGKIETN